MTDKFLHVCCKAPAKIILFGEHAVVYGRLGLASSLESLCGTMSVSMEACINGDDPVDFISFTFDAMNGIALSLPFQKLESFIPLFVGSKDFQFDSKTFPQAPSFTKALNDLVPVSLDELPRLAGQVFVLVLVTFLRNNMPTFRSFKNYRFKFTSDVPLGSGLGSSAVFAITLSSCLHSLLKIPIQSSNDSIGREIPIDLTDLNTKIFELAMVGESWIHGTSSGIDPFVSLHGGLIAFSRNNLSSSLSTRSCHLFTEAISINIPSINILVVNSNISRNSKTAIASVQARLHSVTFLLLYNLIFTFVEF